MGNQYKLKLVDGNHAFVIELPNVGWGGWEMPDGLVAATAFGRYQSGSDKFKLFRTTDSGSVYAFKKSTQGALLHWERISASSLLPSKVLPENKESLAEDLGIESISELYRPVYDETEVELFEVDLDDFEPLPDIDQSAAPEVVPEGLEWNTYLNYLPFGPVWHGYLPGYLTGARESVAKAVDVKVCRTPGVKIWTHKAREGGVHGHRDVAIDISVPGVRSAAKSVGFSFYFPVSDQIKAPNLAEGVAAYNKLVDSIVADIQSPVRLVNAYAAEGAND